MSYDRFGNKAKAKKAGVKKRALVKNEKPLLGAREANNLGKIFALIDECEKEARKLLAKTALAYYNAGNILMGVIRRWSPVGMSAKAVAEKTGFPERRISLALKIFSRFESNPDLLKNMELRDALKLIAPPPPAGEDGYNRVDLGGGTGQGEFDFSELFNLPPSANKSLRNYRTVGDLLSEIIVVYKTADNRMTSKSFARFYEDIPQNPALRAEFAAMSNKTQAAIEDYLAALEREEAQG